MGVIDSFLTNSENIAKGFKEIRGLRDYIIVRQGAKVVCYFYDSDQAGEAIVNKYLEDNNYNKEELKIEKKTLKNKSEELESMLLKKIVILDKKLVIYEDVVKLSRNTEIKGYKEGKLKNKLNVFKTE